METPASGPVAVTRYGLGARGVDLMERTAGSTVTLGFPLYDAHGNNVATLSRSGSTYAIGDRRSYDAWGVVRAQQSTGDPKLRYCASLGHKQDDESGLVYMRARYYEPSSGRFISEDSQAQGRNWFIYANDNPANLSDSNGHAPSPGAIGWGAWGLAFWFISTAWQPTTPEGKALKNFVTATMTAIGGARWAAGCLAMDEEEESAGPSTAAAVAGGVGMFVSGVIETLAIRQLMFWAALETDDLSPDERRTLSNMTGGCLDFDDSQ